MQSGTFSFFKGPPYAMLKNGKIHTNVIQCIRYSKDGSKFATCSNDKKIHIFDGKTAEPISTVSTDFPLVRIQLDFVHDLDLKPSSW